MRLASKGSALRSIMPARRGSFITFFFAVAVLARFVYDPREPHYLASLELDAPRERGALAPFHVVCDALTVLERAVLPPDLAGLERHAAVGFDFLFGNRNNESIDVVGHEKSPWA